MTLMNSLFGTSGIRGNAEELFTQQFCFDIGRAFGKFLGEKFSLKKVAIGSDPRSSSPRIKAQVCSGLIYEGFEVIDQGIAPIPAMNCILLKKDSEFCGSIMVSGSHIKAELNGLKFFAGKEEILKDDEKKIEEIYRNLKNSTEFVDLSQKVLNKPEAIELYTAYLTLFAKAPYINIKGIVDSGNGAQSGIISALLNKLGLEILAINDSNSVGFMARDTEVESDFEGLKKSVVETKSDFGIGFDSDGDRVVFVDENGTYITGDYTGTLVAKSISSEKIVTPINASGVIDTIGKNIIRTMVGSPYVVSAMKENNATFGFEANGGGIFNEMHSRDGGRMAIEVLNLLNSSGKKLSELIAELPKFYIERDKIDYKWELKDEINKAAKEKFVGIRIDEQDGLKVWLDNDSWILFRSSQNAPEFRVFVESKSEDRSKELLSAGLNLVKKVTEK